MAYLHDLLQKYQGTRCEERSGLDEPVKCHAAVYGK
jgi:hypothetical protein